MQESRSFLRAAPFADRSSGQRVDDRLRRVEAAAGGALVAGHQRLEHFAEHFRVDVCADRVALVNAEGEALKKSINNMFH